MNKNLCTFQMVCVAAPLWQWPLGLTTICNCTGNNFTSNPQATSGKTWTLTVTSRPDKHHGRPSRQLSRRRQQLLPLSTRKERNFPNSRLRSEIQERISIWKPFPKAMSLLPRKCWNVRHCWYRLRNRNLLDRVLVGRRERHRIRFRKQRQTIVWARPIPVRS